MCYVSQSWPLDLVIHFTVKYAALITALDFKLFAVAFAVILLEARLKQSNDLTTFLIYILE